ncbi:MAG: MFS transporter [Candidatus Sumerlaeota bacterium]|nr:MFS transporter [Candidatus Sumerlaeota bacterium]
MAETQAANGSGALAGVHPARLFTASCISLIATAVAFATVGDIMGDLKVKFILTNQQVGWIGGAAMWGFTISIFILGPLCDALGMRRLLRFALLCHGLGVLVMIFADGFWMLFAGALIIALGNGTIEAGCNPLVATIYPDRKTQKLSQFHVWFPGGIVLGGLASYALGRIGLSAAAATHLWQIRLGLILIPTVVYGILFTGQKFPATERVQAGVSFGGMFQAALLRPLFLLLFVCMMLTASMELGPNRWLPSVLQAGGIPGILVLVWISGLMAVLRFFAGPVIHRLSNTGILLGSSILAAIGLYWLSYAETGAMAFASATVFAVGVCYYWPTMLGTVAERVPKGGALALALMGGIGMAIVGLVTSPVMGDIADKYLNEKLPMDKTVAVLQQAVDTFPALAAQAKGDTGKDITAAMEKAKAALGKIKAEKNLVEPDTANALRDIINTGGDAPAAKEAGALLGPADNFGGRMSFRYVAPVGVILIIIFGLLFASDRAKGGYKAESIHS